MAWLKNLLASRGFWVLLVSVAPQILGLLHVSDETTSAVLSIVGAIAAYFGVAVTRAALGSPTSHAAAVAQLDSARGALDRLARKGA